MSSKREIVGEERVKLITERIMARSNLFVSYGVTSFTGADKKSEIHVVLPYSICNHCSQEHCKKYYKGHTRDSTEAPVLWCSRFELSKDSPIRVFEDINGVVEKCPKCGSPLDEDLECLKGCGYWGYLQGFWVWY